jgi:hypothetical protein
MQVLISILSVIGLLAYLDRLWGGGFRVANAKLNALITLLACVALANVFVFGLPPAPAALWALATTGAWWLYRSPAYKIFGGSIDPTGGPEIAGTLARWLTAMGFVPLVHFRHGTPWLVAVLSFGLFAVLATMLAVEHHRYLTRHPNDGTDINGRIELLRGALLGVAYTKAWVFSPDALQF